MIGEGENRGDRGRSLEPIVVSPWPSELVLKVLVILAAIGLWGLLILSIFGILYGVLIGVFVFLSHVMFVAHVRGSAVKLEPDQFPELYERVHSLAHRMGIDPVPEAYVMQQGGSLNAFATRFLRSEIIVLFSDLLDECQGDEGARDMIIGHELGHIKAGHLRWHWLLVPGMFVPFLGAAYSRARELTCDRYGAAAAGSADGALRGLTILAAGGRLGRQVNVKTFADQRSNLDTGWMTLATWLSGYPPLAARVAALDPALASSFTGGTRGMVRAFLIIAAVFLLPIVGMMSLVGVAMTGAMKELREAAAIESKEADDYGYDDEELPEVEDVQAAIVQARAEIAELAAMVRQYEVHNGFLPDDLEPIYRMWNMAHPDDKEPTDPFDGHRYGYWEELDGFSISSAGPDQEYGTGDDITVTYASEAAADDG